MEYLFFDIECADGSHMCSFGYVITDDKFNIKEKNDILINPQCEFKLGKYRKQPYISLAYSEKQFYDSPTFNEQYNRIREILLCKERTALGHAIESDMEFLDIACGRYKKPLLNATVYDTQKIYAQYSQSGNVKALEKIMEEMGIDISELSAHKSCDDAEMSMLTMREICARSQINISEILYNSKKYIVNRKYMEIVYRSRQIRKFLQNIKRNAHNSERKKIYIADVIERIKINKTREILHAIYNAGYGFSFDAEKCDYNVSVSPDTKSSNPEIQYIDYNTLSDMLGVKITQDGNVEYSESESAENTLKQFFEKAAKNQPRGRKYRAGKK